MAVTVPSYTKASLPTVASPGDLARVTDAERGLWMYTGTQWRKIDPYIDLRDFAVGDGTTDDTTAVTNFLNAVQASGYVGFVPTGRYRITSAITITLANDQDFTILGPGSGGGTVQVASFNLDANLANNDTPMIKIDGNDQSAKVTFEGVRFAATGTGGRTGSGLQIYRTYERTVVNRCRFSSFQGRGLWLKQLIGVTVSNSHFEENGTGCDHEGTSSVGEGVITACKFATNTTRALYINTGSTFLSVLGCTFIPTGQQTGVELASGVECIGFYQCSFENATPGIYLPSGSAKYITIENCSFNPSSTSGTKYGIDLNEVSLARIQNNIVNASAGSGGTIVGIRITTATDATVGPNQFSNSGIGTLTNYSLPANAEFGIFTDRTGKKVAFVDSLSTAILSGPSTSVASNGVLPLGNYTAGLLVVRSGDAPGVFAIGSATVTEISDPSNKFSTSDSTANSTNVYYQAASSRYEIKNTNSDSRSIQVSLIGVN